jgi:hypothetical protein
VLGTSVVTEKKKKKKKKSPHQISDYNILVLINVEIYGASF